MWTTAAAFTEASYLIGDMSVSARILADYHFTLDVEKEKPRPAELLIKYAPEMDFADATLVRASEMHPSFKIVTDDEHFEWYRRNDTELIPVEWVH